MMQFWRSLCPWHKVVCDHDAWLARPAAAVVLSLAPSDGPQCFDLHSQKSGKTAVACQLSMA